MEIEIITFNKIAKIETIGIKKGVRYYYFRGHIMTLLLKWINTQDIKLKQFINGLK